MNREEVLYLVPYVLSLLLSGGIFLYAWQHRQVRGGGPYAWFAAGETLSIFGFIMELITPNLQIKILWDKFQWLTEGTIIVVASLAFAIQFTEYQLKQPRRFWAIVLAVPVVFNLLVITDGAHHLIYPNPHLTTDYPFPDLAYDFTAVVNVFALYIYAASLFAIGLLVRGSFRPHNLYRSQLLTMAVGIFIPVAATIFALFNIQITPQRDLSPFSFAIGNLVVAYGLFRYRLFDILPIARERVLENMHDEVIVVDALGRVVDINRAALTSIEKTPRQVIGQPVRVVLAEWREVVEQFKDRDQEAAEISVRTRGDLLYFEMTISPIRDQGKRLLGRVIVLHNITRRKALEDGYRRLSEELEARVQERTRELAEAYDITLEGWAKALEFRDKETEGHSRRVTQLSVRLAGALGLSEEEIVHIYRGAILHDIGKMAIPDEILRKSDALTPQEWEIVRKHPVTAFELLAPIPYLKRALEIPYCHHEKWDGTGYPRGLEGEAIPLSARIFSVADVWDAIQSDRTYNKAWPRVKAVQYVKDQAGRYFDPRVVEVFLKLVETGGI